MAATACGILRAMSAPDRHARQLALPGFGPEAQAALGRARILVIGLGGLGAPAASWLAAAGTGTLVLNDFDRVDLTNLQRQPLYKEADLGSPKATAAARALAALDPGLRYEVRPERLAGAALAAEVGAATVVLDCTDNFGSRFAINAACVAARVPLVSAAAVGWDGLIAGFDARDPASPCYACAFAEDDETLGDCATAGVFGPLTGVIGTLAAAEAAKLAVEVGTPLTGRLLRYDARATRFAESRLPRDPRCPVCGSR
jgi:molybdopterin/thiamine biosynthesis adenylyltransferase